ncbi:hypothetical protein MHK_010453 [Candidatus Magnetomorum sp. HK-1]|nr:hypothetical protein MHK_010453 [Candidatus Magnetomorum sp. HK-1]
MPERKQSSRTIFLTGNETLILDDRLMRPKTSMLFKVINGIRDKDYEIKKTSRSKYLFQ